jgi:copper chaperone CopZ
MMCEASCAKTVEKVLAARPGVEEVVVDFERKQARCRIDPETFDAAAAIAELADQDFVATVEQ